ncbi:MAG: Fe(3+) ABC transporter substrate-binding protein, partial [Alphaproteobacteria bacterium]|nr:Fe(3+) ABC transporter substrate-binding protein [Alphaproteobacteria bacterium]
LLAAGGGPAAMAAEVNLYTSRHYEADAQLYARFTAESGIKVNVVSASAGQLIERLRSEGANSPADLFITADVAQLTRARAAGLLAPVKSGALEQAIPSSLRDPDGHWFALTKRARVIVYARDRVDPASIESYEDLAHRRWQGKILIRSSTHEYNQSLTASMIGVHGVEKSEEWARALVANLARPPRGGDRDQIKGVAEGVGDLAVVNTYYLGHLMTSRDPEDRAIAAKVGVIFPNQNGWGTHVNISGAGVARHAPHWQEAIRFLEFLVTPDAQRVFAEANFEYPVRPGVETTGVIRDLGTFKEDGRSLAGIGRVTAEAVRLMDRVGWR